MSGICLDNIPFQLDMSTLMQRLRVKPNSDMADTLYELAQTAQRIARPKVVYQIASVEHVSPTEVRLNGVTLTSRVMRVNLDQVHRAFPFVVTCGQEVAAWAAGIADLLESYYADTIMEFALRAAINALHAALEERFSAGHLAMMNPGSLEDWPITEQRPLFAIVGDLTDQIGVQLTDSCLMQPIKSVSGILFATDATFESCQLCPIDNCPNRRAPYDAALYAQKYQL
ncbi:MAG: vitamin B12 dependent methionine synthase [Anaerolineae bacterium]|nr:vitamin B12 dependent methionine synthase [Anaerolineae bacterium]